MIDLTERNALIELFNEIYFRLSASSVKTPEWETLRQPVAELERFLAKAGRL